MATEDLVPASDIVTGFGQWGGSSHFGNIDEGYDSPVQGSGETVYSEYAESTIDEYGMSNTVSMGSGDETSQIEVLIYIGWAEADYQGNLDSRIYIAGGYETSVEGSVKITNEYPGGWETKTFTGVWTKAQVDAMQVEITLLDPESSSQDNVGALVARVTYAAGGGGLAIPVVMKHIRHLH